jgi:hypothetical protein
VKWILSIGLLLLSIPTINANEINVLFGGWSKHLEPQATHLPEYNEKHNGFGLEYHQEYTNNKYWLFGINYLKDSYKTKAIGLAGGWQHRWQWQNFFFNSGWFVGAQNRSQTVSYYSQETDIQKFSHIKRSWLPIGGVRFGFGYKYLSSTLSLVPTISKTNKKWRIKNPVLYWQFVFHLPQQTAKKIWATAVFSSKEKRMTAQAKEITMKPHYF